MVEQKESSSRVNCTGLSTCTEKFPSSFVETSLVSPTGHHLLVDCREVPAETCLDDKRMLAEMAAAATEAGATVISQVRYHFGHNSPPGYTAVVLLDESHISAHAYAGTGQIAIDIFTCGSTSPTDIFKKLKTKLDLGKTNVCYIPRFASEFTISSSGR